MSALKKRKTVAKSPMVVTVTGGAGNIAYSLVFQIAHGMMLGLDQPIHLRLLEIPFCAEKLKGVVMELQDGAFPLLHSITGTVDPKEAFTDCEVALLVGARPRGKGMDRSDLLRINAPIFKAAGEALDTFASRDVKVLVVGNPANTNALLTMLNAPSLPRTAFSAMTRLDHQRMIGQLGLKLNVTADRIKNVVVWGNHSNTMYADCNHAVVTDYPTEGKETKVTEAIDDDAWIKGEFLTTVATRGAAIIKARELSSAASAASAALAHVRSWVLGTKEGEWVSMSVPSDGSYGIPEGIVYSFPVTCKDGNYSIVQGLAIDDFSREKIDATAAELLREREAVLAEDSAAV